LNFCGCHGSLPLIFTSISGAGHLQFILSSSRNPQNKKIKNIIKVTVNISDSNSDKLNMGLINELKALGQG
jgi:hypothetical protein